jgi:hypothetical protein
MVSSKPQQIAHILQRYGINRHLKDHTCSVILNESQILGSIGSDIQLINKCNDFGLSRLFSFYVGSSLGLFTL